MIRGGGAVMRRVAEREKEQRRIRGALQRRMANRLAGDGGAARPTAGARGAEAAVHQLTAAPTKAAPNAPLATGPVDSMGSDRLMSATMSAISS